MYFQDRIIHKDADLNVYFPCLACCLHRGCTIQCFPLFMFLLVETALKVWLHLLPQVTVLYHQLVDDGTELHHQPTLWNNLLPCFYLNLLSPLETEQASTFYVVFS